MSSVRLKMCAHIRPISFLDSINIRVSFLFALCLLLNCWPATAVLLENSPPVATIAQGELKGRWFTTRGGRTVAGFLGIPYAIPPVGLLRFKSPQPALPWTDTVYDSSHASPDCLQPHSYKSPSSSEDCLYLNVYTPNVNPNEKYSVLFFIHGGGYEARSSSPVFFGPEYILDEDIILVTINHRLGILGFLSLEHPALPGNLGLKDQRLALRWVKNNIAQFGGDPAKVTLFGQSSGAASAHLHHMFTAEEGLFRAVILSSKSAMSVSAFQRPSAQQPLVDVIVHKTKCPPEPEELVQCLQKLPAEEFLSLLKNVKAPPTAMQRLTVFCPVVEPPCVLDKVVAGDPFKQTTNLPMLVGNTETEGLTVIDHSWPKGNKTETLRILNSNYESELPTNLQFETFFLEPKQVANKLKTFYFGDQPIDSDHGYELADMFSDIHYNHGTVLAARANKAKTYFYQLNYRGENSIANITLGNTTYKGVAHADDLLYFFPFGKSPLRDAPQQDIEVSQALVKMWVNFARFLDPTPEGSPVKWLPVSTPDIEFLNIGQTSFTMDRGFLKDRVSFYDNDLFKHGKSFIAYPNDDVVNNCLVEKYTTLIHYLVFITIMFIVSFI